MIGVFAAHSHAARHTARPLRGVKAVKLLRHGALLGDVLLLSVVLLATALRAALHAPLSGVRALLWLPIVLPSAAPPGAVTCPQPCCRPHCAPRSWMPEPRRGSPSLLDVVLPGAGVLPTIVMLAAMLTALLGAEAG